MAKAKKFKNVTQEELDVMQQFTNSLPKSAFQMVPDDGEVEIIISGFFFRSIVRTLDHVIANADPKEVIRATEYMKLDYDLKKGVDQKLVTTLDTAIWTLSNIITEFNIQAGLQKKTKVYDKTAVSKLMQEMAIDNKLKPLTTEEIEKRQEMERLAKEKEDKEEPNAS